MSSALHRTTAWPLALVTACLIVYASLLCKSCSLNLRLEKKFLSVQKNGVIGLMQVSMLFEPGLTQELKLQVVTQSIFRRFNAGARIGCALVCPLFKGTKELCSTMSQRFWNFAG